MTINFENFKTRGEKNKEGSFDYQKRRHEDWTENYQLYRDKIIINRLTQRQSVNVPLMKETGKTILSKIDDAPDNYYEELSGDEQKELFMNEYWKYTVRDTKLAIKDVVDKKQVFLYGRSFKKLNIVNGFFYFEVLEPYDVLIDRYADPADIDATANHIIHLHIFRTLAQIAENPTFDKDAINRIKANRMTALGLIKNTETVQSLQDKNERLRTLGLMDMDNPIMGGVLLELEEHYVRIWDKENHEEVICVGTYADRELLRVVPLEDILDPKRICGGYWKNHFPLSTWADDVERTDIWSDGVADTIRTPNKILNSWLAQLTENRTMRNFGMQYYDSTGNFVPQTVDPIPFGWYPVPGDPNKKIMRVDIPELSESLDEMQFVLNMAERASAATATEKGQSGKGQITLGEIKIIAQKAEERITSAQKFYKDSYMELGEKFVMAVTGCADELKPVKVYKKGRRGKGVYEKEIKPKDWKSATGYRVNVTTTAEKEKETLDTVQKLEAIAQKFIGNPVLDEIYKKKLLALGKLTPEEINRVIEAEKTKTAPGAVPPDQLPTKPNMPIIPPAKMPAMV